ncbi:MAG: thioredoxin family protein [Pontiella sp.]
MKKWLTVVAAVVISTGAFAAAGWETDFEKAKTMAKEQDKYILIDFSGSDWCGWCIKLDKEVFQQQAFKDYAKEGLVLMLADFPNDKSKQSAEVIKQNEKLAKEFGVRGFPTVFVLDPDGRIVGKTGYQQGGPEAYIAHIKKIIADGNAKK